VARRTDFQQPAFALDHDRADFDQRGTDQRNPRRRIGIGYAANPFGPGPRLAEAAPG
jgi:hypothetical protein